MKRLCVLRFWRAATLLLVIAGVVSSQNIPRTEDTVVKVNTVLLNVPVIVGDKEGRPMTDLKKEEFILYAGGEVQKLEYFADSSTPLTVAILLDTSMRARSVLGDIKRAAADFVSQFGPEDRAMIVTADIEVKVLQELTSNQKKLKQGISGAHVADQPGTYMLDAVYRVLTKDFADIKGRKAMIVLSDSFVGTSYFYPHLLERLTESDILFYPIYYFTPGLLPSNVKSVTIDELVKMRPLDTVNSMAQVTGGRFLAAGASDFKTAFANIVQELRKQYVIGFYPPDPSLEGAYNIRLEVNRPGAVVRTKSKIRPARTQPADEKKYRIRNPNTRSS